MKLLALFALMFVCGILRSQISTTCVPSVSVATSVENGSICIGQSATYTVSGALSYTFGSTPSTSQAFTGTTGVVTPTTHTSYQVIGTNQFGCTSTTQTVIFVNALPPISIAASPTLVCPGFPSSLIASSMPNNPVHFYSWSHGGSYSLSVVNPVYPKTFTVSGTNTVTSCQNTQTVLVAVFVPTFICTNDTAICIGGSIALQASGAISYSWSGGATPANGVAYYSVTPTVQTVYTVAATSQTNSLKCESLKTVWVGIYLQPTITAVASPSRVCLYEPYTITASGGYTYYWPALNTTTDNLVITPTVYTNSVVVFTYELFGTDIYGCRDTFELKVQVHNCHPPPPPPVIGVQEQENHELRVFPNPADKFLILEIVEPVSFIVNNSVGQVVKEIRISSPGSYRIPIQELPSGVYVLSGWHEGTLFREKMIISR